MAKQLAIVQQAAALAIHNGCICLIMSGSGKQWLIPKGHVEPGEDLHETALREAWEEAGLSGSVEGQSLGHYHYEKCGRTYRVTVFLMQVSDVADHWPECGLRPRRWLPPPQATRAIQQPALRELLNRVLLAEQLAGVAV